MYGSYSDIIFVYFALINVKKGRIIKYASLSLLKKFFMPAEWRTKSFASLFKGCGGQRGQSPLVAHRSERNSLKSRCVKKAKPVRLLAKVCYAKRHLFTAALSFNSEAH